MSLEIAIKKYTNPEYRVNYSEASNICTVVFEKGYCRYKYLFLIGSKEAYYMLVSDRDSYNEINNIFNSNVLELMDTDVKTIHHDINFMNIFCFGACSCFDRTSVDHIMNAIRISGQNALEFAGMTIENNEFSFSITYNLKFNINTGFISYEAEYIYFNEDHNEIFKSTIWEIFKDDFMRVHASSKIEKKLNDLTFLDAPIVQMMNI